MHHIEPFYNWRDAYMSEEDALSPFYRRTYSEFSFTHSIYNYLIHPQWDYFGSPTLYLKILFADYVHRICVLELFGEWNDAIHNDIMFLKREVLEVLTQNGICKFVLIGENVLNFHESDDCYYEEWYEEVKENEGWIAFINFREHVLAAMRQAGIHAYVLCGEKFNDVNWRAMRPYHMLRMVESRMHLLSGK